MKVTSYRIDATLISIPMLVNGAVTDLCVSMIADTLKKTAKESVKKMPRYWVSGWDLKEQDENSILVQTPQDMWNAVKTLADTCENIIITPIEE